MINDQEQQRIWRLLDVRGSIKMTSDTKPNEAEIIIVNQSDDSFKFAARKGLNMIFRAGYGDNVAQVFKGAIEWVDPAKEENDWVTTIRSKDGAINYRNISIQKTFKKDTPIATVIQGVIDDLLVNPAMQDRIDQINKLAKGTIDLQKIQLNYARAQQTHNRGKKTKALSFEEFKAKQLAQSDSRAANANQIKLLKPAL
jgi:hypothetical protein